MHPTIPPLNERGIALVMVLLLSLALSALAIGATAVSMNGGLIRRYSERLAVVETAALAGLEEARSSLNGTAGSYPDSGYVTLENGVVVRDAAGVVIPGLTRWTYAGPSGVSSGQYGVFGSIISVVQDQNNIRTVRRMEVVQESFAKYAYFTDNEGGNIYFGGGDNIYGPVHSNDNIQIHSTGARFRDIVRTAGSVSGAGYGTFDVGYETGVSIIPMPTPADVAKLQTQAAAGNLSFTGFTSGGTGEARTRIEFVALDLNGDGDTTDEDEGFIRVYQGASGREDYVVAARPSGDFYSSGNLDVQFNCGDYSTSHTTHPASTGSTFMTIAVHTNNTRQSASADHSSLKCYLGGDPVLTGGFTVTTPNPVGGASLGAWLPWTGSIDPRVANAPNPQGTGTIGATQAGYLHPITRALNPSFKGVIFVSGKVAISGKVRSRVTLGSTGDIIIADNVTQVTDPATGVCDDILGIVAGGFIRIADNLINAPVKYGSNNNEWRTVRGHPGPADNTSEWIHAVLLTLNSFTVQNYDTGPTNRESCDGTSWGRGCIRLTGGIIQETRGAVGTTAGTGNLKRYSYNTCALTDPPPYFPTTGHFARNRVYEIDPVGFNIATWFALYQM